MNNQFNDTPQSVIIKDNLTEYVKTCDIDEIIFSLNKITLQTALAVLKEKTNLQFICQNLNNDFIKNIIEYIKEKNIQENLQYPCHFETVWEVKDLKNNQSTYQTSVFETSQKDAKKFRNAKIEKINSFYESIFIGVIKEIDKKNSIKILNTINSNTFNKNQSYWKNEENLKLLALSCYKIDNEFQVKNLISKMEKFNKAFFFKELLIISKNCILLENVANYHNLSFDSYSLDDIGKIIPQLVNFKNLNLLKKMASEIKQSYRDEFFHKVIAYSGSVESMEDLLKVYKKEIVQSNIVYSSGNQEWLKPNSKDNKNYWKNMTTFDKVLWLEEKNLGLKAMNYKYLDYWILRVKNKEDFFAYLDTGKNEYQENILIKEIEKILKENNNNPTWNEKLISNSLDKNSNKSYHQVISNFLMDYKLDFSLPEKLQNKTKSIKI